MAPKKTSQQSAQKTPTDALAAARAAKKASGSRLPAEELGVTNRLAELRNIDGELSDAQRSEKTALTLKKKQMSFSRLAKKYLKNALKDISNLQGLSGSAYVSTPEQIEKISNMLQDSVATCIASFGKATPQAQEDFDI